MTADEKLEKHMNEDKAFQDRMERLLLGDSQNQEIGMKQKVDAMYDVLIQSRGIITFFGGIRGLVYFIVLFGGAIAIIKGWVNFK